LFWAIFAAKRGVGVVGWLYNRNYVGPDRRSERFHVRFFERRREEEASASSSSLRDSLKRLAGRGLRWVNHLNYFGPDRRGDDFSYFFLERRRQSNVGAPPPLHAALRQLRVRLLEVDCNEARESLRDRITATAILAEAQSRSDISDVLLTLANKFDSGDHQGDLMTLVQAEMLRAEAMLGDFSR
jgi:hypothetical protein